MINVQGQKAEKQNDLQETSETVYKGKHIYFGETIITFELAFSFI